MGWFCYLKYRPDGTLSTDFFVFAQALYLVGSPLSSGFNSFFYKALTCMMHY